MVNYILYEYLHFAEKEINETIMRQEKQMTELLAPAGSMEALKAAIANGCDAIYLGLQKFGARAYSDNFSADTLKEAVDYAHLRDVKI